MICNRPLRPMDSNSNERKMMFNVCECPGLEEAQCFLKKWIQVSEPMLSETHCNRFVLTRALIDHDALSQYLHNREHPKCFDSQIIRNCALVFTLLSDRGKQAAFFPNHCFHYWLFPSAPQKFPSPAMRKTLAKASWNFVYCFGMQGPSKGLK